MSAENGRKGGSLNIPTMHFAWKEICTRSYIIFQLALNIYDFFSAYDFFYLLGKGKQVKSH